MESAQRCILGHVGQHFVSLNLVLRKTTVRDSAMWLRFLVFSFGVLTLPSATLASKPWSGCRRCASRSLCSRSPNSGVVSFRVKRHDILWLSSLSTRTRPVFTKACFVPPAITTLHGASLQNTGRTTKTQVEMGMILRLAARPRGTYRINVGKPGEWDTSCTSSHVAVAQQPQRAVRHEASTAWFLSGKGLESCPTSVEEHKRARHAGN